MTTKIESTMRPLSPDDCRIFQTQYVTYCYVPITKVASTYLRRALPAQEFDIYNWCWYRDQGPLPSKEDLNYVVVLRDPVDRWISGVTEFWSRAYPAIDWDDPRAVIEQLGVIEFDVHTQPQIDFLSHVDFARTVWLRCDQSIDRWFEEHGIKLRPVADQDSNPGHTRVPVYFDDQGQRISDPTLAVCHSVDSSVVQQAARLALNNVDLYQRVKQHYKCDYDLVNSVGFY